MDDMTRMTQLLKKYGRNVHSFLALEPGLKYWFSPSTEGGIGYVRHGGYRVCVGAPLCRKEELAQVSREFQRQAASQKEKVVFFGVSERFFQSPETESFDALKFAEQPLWDPRNWSSCKRRNQKLRNRLRRSRRDGVRTEVLSRSQLDRGEVEGLTRHWQDLHQLPPMKFMVQIELFGHGAERMYLAARRGERLVGMAVAVPIYGLEGWLLEDLITDRSRGVGEALIDAFMTEAVRREAAVVSLGLVPLMRLGTGVDNHPGLRLLLQVSKHLLKPLYNAEGLRRFRAKLHPDRWESVYLASPGKLSFWSLRAVMMSFAGGWVPAYGWRALKRITCPHGRTCCA
jgi:phosphatidylglycerol lysyltransferase